MNAKWETIGLCTKCTYGILQIVKLYYKCRQIWRYLDHLMFQNVPYKIINVIDPYGKNNSSRNLTHL